MVSEILSTSLLLLGCLVIFLLAYLLTSLLVFLLDFLFHYYWQCGWPGAGLIKIKTKFSPQLDLAKLELGLSLAKSLS